MATKGKKISEVSVLDSLQGDEMFPLAVNGENGAVSAGTIKDFCSPSNDFTDDDKAKLEAVPVFWFGTKDMYDAITEKDPNILYFIEEEES